jgi:hypothetical protein
VLISFPPHLGCRIENGAHDLVVAGASAEVPGEFVANLLLGRVRVLVEKGFGRDKEARGANAALKGRMFEELLLEGVEAFGRGEAFHGENLSPLCFDGEYEARADDIAVEKDAAGAAVSGCTAFLRASEVEFVPQDFQQRLAGFAEDFGFLAVQREFQT